MESRESAAGGKIIFVLGMHRSGTSVTTNLLSELGVPLSDDLMPATDANRRGYFESQEISQIHDTILGLFDLKWNMPTTLRPLPQHWWRTPAVEPHKNRLRDIAREQVDGRRVWAFKDPRTARLLPMWKEIVAELGLDARYLLVTRHPSEVAGSLLSRDNLDPVIAELLWLEHNADALFHCGTHISAIVDYDEWMVRPFHQAQYMIEKLGIEYGGSESDLQSLLDRVIAHDLRHQAPAGSAHLPFSGPLYSALRAKDFKSAMNLVEVFNISKGFTTIVVSRVHERLAELATAVDQRNQRIAGLEQYIRSFNPNPPLSNTTI